MEKDQREWRGSPLEVDGTIDYRGVREVVIELEDGNADEFRPKRREEFHSYEINQMAAYLQTVANGIHKGGSR